MDGQQEETVVVTTSCVMGEERSSEALLSHIDLNRRSSYASTTSTSARSGYESALSSPRSPNPILFRIPEIAASLSRRSSVLLGVADFPALVTSSSSPLAPTPPTTTNPQWPLLSPSLLLPTRLFSSEAPMRPMASLLTLSGRYQCSHCEFSSDDRFFYQLHMIQVHADYSNVPLNAFFGQLLPPLSTYGIQAPIQMLPSGELLNWLPPAITGASASSSSSSSSSLSASRLPPIGLHYDASEPSTGDSSAATPDDHVRCETCGKFLPKKKPLSSLLNHAKRHYLLKQFICLQCPYGSSEAAHVRNHMKLRHNVVDRDPLDVRNASLQEAWLKITSRCFPTMTAELTRFRFKRFRKRNRKRTESEPSCSSQPPTSSGQDSQDRSSNEDSSDSSPRAGTSADAS
uniref:C2H2-type domain-containing protein n=1 Tax=Plectus sambesii TaxID=2011161 RepID=A0A914WJV6_9BILA